MCIMKVTNLPMAILHFACIAIFTIIKELMKRENVKEHKRTYEMRI